jgi:hypothetical protein
MTSPDCNNTAEDNEVHESELFQDPDSFYDAGREDWY